MKRRKEQDDNDDDTEMLETISLPISIIDDDDDDKSIFVDNETKVTKLPLVEISLEPGGWDDMAIVHCFDMTIHQHDQYDESTFTFIPKHTTNNTSILESTDEINTPPLDPKDATCAKLKKDGWKPQKVPLPQWAIDPVFATVELNSSD